MIDRLIVDRIISAVDIVEVVGDFITLRKKGTNYTACCPFHSEKTPSFMVSPAKGLYKCFGCGKGGGAINFVMEHEKLSYPEALRWLAKKYNIEIEEKPETDEERQRNNDRESMLVLNSWAESYFTAQMTDTETGRAVGLSYFYERGFNELTIKKFGLGYCSEEGSRNLMSHAAIKEGFQEKFLISTGLTIIREEDHSYYDRFAGRVMFPIHSISGRTIGFGGRTMRTDKKTAKYLNSPQSEIYDKSQTLYGIFQAKKAIVAQNKCILVEGYTDVMQMHQSGIENVVASSGTSLTAEQVRLIKRFTRNVTVIYDGDSAGIKASLRGIDIILAEGLSVRVVPLPQGDDPDSFARSRSTSDLTRYIEEYEEDFLSFKTRILLHGENDPIARAELINDIVRSIAIIPDPIAREVYISECSRAMDISTEVLSRSVASAIVRSTTSVPRQAATREREQQKQQSHTKQDDVFAPVPNENYEPQAAVSQTRKKGSATNTLEVELAGYLIKYGNDTFPYEVTPENIIELGVTELIVNEMNTDEIDFSDPVCGSILHEAREAFKRSELLSTKYYTEHQDPAIQRLAANILMKEDTYQPSKMWARYEIRVTTERERLSEAVPKAIVIYKTMVISAKIAQIQEEMLREPDSIDTAAVERIKELNAGKALMNDRYKRLL